MMTQAPGADQIAQRTGGMKESVLGAGATLSMSY